MAALVAARFCLYIRQFVPELATVDMSSARPAWYFANHIITIFGNINIARPIPIYKYSFWKIIKWSIIVAAIY